MNKTTTSPGKKASLKMDNLRERWGVPLAVLCMLLVWFMPTPVSLALAGKKALVLFSGVFVLYLTEAIPLAITSLAVVPGAVLLGVTNLKGALDGFSSSSVYLLVGAFILASAMVKTQLAERITYVILSKIGCSTRNITIGVTLANVCLAFLVPSSTARTAILLPVCLSIISTFKAEGRSHFAIGLLLTLAFTNATIGAGILTATVPNPVTIDFIIKAGGPAISYLDWLIYGFPPALLMTFFAWWFIQRVYHPERSEIPGGQEHIDEKLAHFGKMTSPEWRALIVFAIVVILWAAGSLLKMDATTACLIGVVLLFLPKFGVLTWADANKGVSWQIVLVCGGGISLGDMLMKTGAAKWLAVSIFNALGLHTLSTLALLILVMVVIQYLHIFFVGTTAMATAFLPIILALAAEANLPPAVLALPAGMIIGGYPLLMFYNTLPNILVYGTGQLRMEDFPRVGIVICAVACIFYAFCAATYWRWVGLF
jgi:anion transporter